MNDQLKSPIKFLRAEAALKLKPEIKAEARDRMLAGEGLSHDSIRGATRNILAEMAGISHDTLRRVEIILAKADAETLDLLRSGKISINAVYRQLFPLKPKL